MNFKYFSFFSMFLFSVFYACASEGVSIYEEKKKVEQLHVYSQTDTINLYQLKRQERTRFYKLEDKERLSAINGDLKRACFNFFLGGSLWVGSLYACSKLPEKSFMRETLSSTLKSKFIFPTILVGSFWQSGTRAIADSSRYFVNSICEPVVDATEGIIDNTFSKMSQDTANTASGAGNGFMGGLQSMLFGSGGGDSK